MSYVWKKHIKVRPLNEIGGFEVNKNEMSN